MVSDERFAKVLGWFSLGIGLIEVLMPRSLARCIGVSDDAGTQRKLRMMGLREIASGVAILAQRRPLNAVKARIGGDAMDLAFLGNALRDDSSQRTRLATAAVAVAGVTALDILCCERLTKEDEGAGNWTGGYAADVKEAVTVDKPIEDLFAFWRDFSNLPKFMQSLDYVEVTSKTTSRWVMAESCGGGERQVDIINERPNELIAWRAYDGEKMVAAGAVNFDAAPGERGTVVRIDIHSSVPGGVLGLGIANLKGKGPDKMAWETLHRFKQLMETGEIAVSQSTVNGTPLIQPAAR